MADVLLQTDLPFPKTGGKVRDVYDLDAVAPGRLLLVATDRTSAYDVVMPNGVPGKGVLLTGIARFWFDRFADVPNHLAGDVADVAALAEHRDVLEGRTMLVRRLDVVPYECVARGYLAGSGLVEYRKHGTVCGIDLPGGLVEGSRLPEPIFTPATKAATGHDENVSFDRMADDLGRRLATELRDRTLDLYRRAADYAESRGLILADTKLEWGRDPDADDAIVLADEIFTPDSSRYWPADTWQPGRAQPSFDKQFVRDHLATLDWDRTPPAPTLPDDVVEGTLARYRDAYRRLTGDAPPA